MVAKCSQNEQLKNDRVTGGLDSVGKKKLTVKSLENKQQMYVMKTVKTNNLLGKLQVKRTSYVICKHVAITYQK